MNKWLVVLLCSCIAVSGCSGGRSRIQSAGEETGAQDEPVTDGRMSDRALLLGDEDQQVGDLGVERLYREIRTRSIEPGVRPYAASRCSTLAAFP